MRTTSTSTSTSTNTNGDADKRERDADLPAQRDGRGRFLPGNRIGVDINAINRVKAALYAAVDDDTVTELMSKMIDAARDGNARACKWLIETVVGKPRPAPEPAVPLPFELPDVSTLAGCSVALSLVLVAVERGELSMTHAAALNAMIENQRKTIESRELEVRVRDLEKALQQAATLEAW